MSATDDRTEHRRLLLDDLDEHERNGLLVPCRRGSLAETAAWIDDDPDAQATAAALHELTRGDLFALVKKVSGDTDDMSAAHVVATRSRRVRRDHRTGPTARPTTDRAGPPSTPGRNAAGEGDSAPYGFRGPRNQPILTSGLPAGPTSKEPFVPAETVPPTDAGGPGAVVLVARCRSCGAVQLVTSGPAR